MSSKTGNKNRLLLTAIVCSILIAIGLGVGLGIGLRNDGKTNGSGLHCNDSKTEDDDAVKDDDEEESSRHINSSSASYRYAAVASDAGICSSIGTDILARLHGSAIDAVIATLLCMGVANAHSMGIGGGFFMTVYDKANNSVMTLDAREVAPAASTETMFGGNRTLAKIGGLAVAVPGELSGYWAAHKRFGRLTWATLFQPTIKLCNEGVPIGHGLGPAIQRMYPAMVDNPGWREKFTDNSTGEPLPLGEGDVYYCKKLAATLKIIADEGANAFYNGSLSQDIIDDLGEHDSPITLEDLQKYTPEWRDPMVFDLGKDLTLYTLPAPSGGPMVTYMMNILRGYNFTSEDMKTADKRLLTYHRMIEAMKFAHANKPALGDPSYVDVSQLLQNMTSLAQGLYINAKIDDDQTYGVEYYGPTFTADSDTGTAHVSLVDADGNAVSVTSSVNYYFGSRIEGSRTGIIFNNLMDDFSLPLDSRPSPPNFIEPGKRPLSSMCPAIVLDGNGDAKLVVGAAGGSKITTALVQTMLRTLYFDEDLDVAVNSGRFHHQLMPPYLFPEKDMFPKEVISGLEGKGHNVSYLTSFSVVQAVIRDDTGVLTAVADGRKGGLVDGY